MILPVTKLGTLALKTLCKPIASRLKKEAGLHPRFHQFIIEIAQRKLFKLLQDILGELFVFSVAGASVIIEVQRRSRSEARKEELRKQELEAMMQIHEELAREVELLKPKLEELEHAMGRGLTNNWNVRIASAGASEDNSTPTFLIERSNIEAQNHQ